MGRKNRDQPEKKQKSAGRGVRVLLLLGALVLNESVTGLKAVGVAVIILGLVLLSSSGKGEKA